MFDPTKVTYLGTANSGTRICVTYEKSKVRSFKQAMTEKIVLGGVAPGDAVHDFAYMVRATTGAPIERRSPATRARSTSTLAMERGEVDGACGWDWSSAKAQKPEWIRDGKLEPPAADRPERQRRADQAGRAAARRLHKGRRQPPGHGADREPAGVPAAVFRRHGHARGLRRDPAQGVRRHHAGSSSSWPTPRSCASTSRRCRARPCRTLVQKFYATPKHIVEQGRRAIRP